MNYVRQGELDRAQALRAYALSADIFTALGLLVGGAGGALYWFDHGDIVYLHLLHLLQCKHFPAVLASAQNSSFKRKSDHVCKLS